MPVVQGMDMPIRLLNGCCKRHGYQPLINGVANPQTKAEFWRAHLIKYSKGEARQQEMSDAEAAIKTDIDNVNIT